MIRTEMREVLRENIVKKQEPQVSLAGTMKEEFLRLQRVLEAVYKLKGSYYR